MKIYLTPFDPQTNMATDSSELTDYKTLEDVETAMGCEPVKKGRRFSRFILSPDMGYFASTYSIIRYRKGVKK